MIIGSISSLKLAAPTQNRENLLMSKKLLSYDLCDQSFNAGNGAIFIFHSPTKDKILDECWIYNFSWTNLVDRLKNWPK